MVQIRRNSQDALTRWPRVANSNIAAEKASCGLIVSTDALKEPSVHCSPENLVLEIASSQHGTDGTTLRITSRAAIHVHSRIKRAIGGRRKIGITRISKRLKTKDVDLAPFDKNIIRNVNRNVFECLKLPLVVKLGEIILLRHVLTFTRRNCEHDA